FHFLFFFFFFFFFQAEDGIRDLTVTGVQTCALPISAPHVTPDRCSRIRRVLRGDDAPLRLVIVYADREEFVDTEAFRRRVDAARSEERRVGKECRSRWSAYD